MAVIVALAGAAAGCSADLPAAAATCQDEGALILLAQSVPQAESIPCFESLPFAYRTTTFDAESGRAEIALSHAVVGLDAAVFTIAETCLVDGGGDVAVPNPEPGERLEALQVGDQGGVTGRWIHGLGGACMVVELSLDHPDGQRALEDLDGSWVLRPRQDVLG